VLGEIFQRFVEKSPISVMVRGTLERILGAEALDHRWKLSGGHRASAEAVTGAAGGRLAWEIAGGV
jgi:hypothetical protein